MRTTRLQTAMAIIIPLINVVFLGAAIIFDAYFFHFTILAFIIADVLLYLYLPHGIQMKVIMRIAGLPSIYYLATAAALFFSNSFVLSIFLLLALFWLQMSYFFIQKGVDTIQTKNPVFSQISLLICLGSFFSLSILFFSLIYFLDVPFWYLIIPFLILVLIVQELVFSPLNTDRYIRALIALISAVGLTELLYAISWLPLEYLSLAGVASLLYALYMDIVLCTLGGEYSKKRILFSSLFVFCMLVLLVTMVRWR